MALVTERLITYTTRVWLLPTMYVLSDHITLLTELLITYRTGVWLLPNMFVLMCHQITLKTGCLITYTTGIWPLPTMYDQITISLNALLYTPQEYGSSPVCMC